MRNIMSESQKCNPETAPYSKKVIEKVSGQSNCEIRFVWSPCTKPFPKRTGALQKFCISAGYPEKTSCIFALAGYISVKWS